MWSSSVRRRHCSAMLNSWGIAKVDSDGGSDVASEASADASQGGSCTRGYVASTIRRVGAAEGLDMDCF